MARDADSGEILAFRCSTSKSPQDGKKFIDAVLTSCYGRPLLRVGRGQSFPHNLRSLDLYFHIDTTASEKIRQRITNFFLGGSEPFSRRQPAPPSRGSPPPEQDSSS